jgi:hypothetical protein
MLKKTILSHAVWSFTQSNTCIYTEFFLKDCSSSQKPKTHQSTITGVDPSPSSTPSPSESKMATAPQIGLDLTSLPSSTVEASTIDLHPPQTADPSAGIRASSTPITTLSLHGSFRSSLSVDAVTGCATGGVVFVILVMLSFWFLHRKRKKRRVAPSAEFLRRRPT